jgi:hypothetical protein
MPRPRLLNLGPGLQHTTQHRDARPVITNRVIDVIGHDCFSRSTDSQFAEDAFPVFDCLITIEYRNRSVHLLLPFVAGGSHVLSGSLATLGEPEQGMSKGLRAAGGCRDFTGR